MAQEPPMGRGLLIIEGSRSHSDTPQSVGLLWTRDQPHACIFTWQHRTIITDGYPCPRRYSRWQSPASEGPQTDALDRAAHQDRRSGSSTNTTIRQNYNFFTGKIRNLRQKCFVWSTFYVLEYAADNIWGAGFVGYSVSLLCWRFCCNTANSLHATAGSCSSMCIAVLWLNALDFPPDTPPSSSAAADRLRSLDGAFHTSINVTRCRVLHFWRTDVWSGNIEDRLSKDNTFHTCYVLTITFHVVFCFQFRRHLLASEENTSTSGHLNVAILNHIHQQKQYNKITNCT